MLTNTATTEPRCTGCGTRTPRRHFAVGFFKQCVQCRGSREPKNRTRQQRCSDCGKWVEGKGRWCSNECNRRYAKQRAAWNKAVVLAALGGICTCTELGCAHEGPCEVALADVLVVHHEHEDGGRVRGTKRDGTLGSGRYTGGVSGWSRYRRALSVADHGMRLLCHNCHHAHHARGRRALAGDIVVAASLEPPQRRQWATAQERTAQAQKACQARWEGKTSEERVTVARHAARARWQARRSVHV